MLPTQIAECLIFPLINRDRLTRSGSSRLLNRHELVDEDRSGGNCAGIVEEADRSKHHLRQHVGRAS